MAQPKYLLAALILAAIVAGGTARADTAPLVNEAIVNAPVAEVWRLFTTREGMESWMVAQAEIDLKVGGLIRTHYDPKGRLGDGKTIVNRILSYEPQRMLSLKVQQAPADFPFPKGLDDNWTVIYFIPLEPGMTNVRIVGMGYADDEDGRKLRQFFADGNGWTLEQLQKKFWPKCALCEKQ